MIDRRDLLRDSSVAAFGALALTTVAAGAAEAGTTDGHALLPNLATTKVPNPPFPKGLSATEHRHLKTFDTLDFVVFSKAEWNRLSESHSPKIRVHWPDGHFTDGIDQHIADLKAMFVWAPDTHIDEHPIRIAMDELTAVVGVMKGTFSKPMPDGKGGHIAPTGKSYSLPMATVGIWDRRKNHMDEEFLFWDNQTFYSQIGLG